LLGTQTLSAAPSTSTMHRFWQAVLRVTLV